MFACSILFWGCFLASPRSPSITGLFRWQAYQHPIYSDIHLQPCFCPFLALQLLFCSPPSARKDELCLSRTSTVQDTYSFPPCIWIFLQDLSTTRQAKGSYWVGFDHFQLFFVKCSTPSGFLFPFMPFFQGSLKIIKNNTLKANNKHHSRQFLDTPFQWAS